MQLSATHTMLEHSATAVLSVCIAIVVCAGIIRLAYLLAKWLTLMCLSHGVTTVKPGKLRAKQV